MLAAYIPQILKLNTTVQITQSSSIGQRPIKKMQKPTTRPSHYWHLFTSFPFIHFD